MRRLVCCAAAALLAACTSPDGADGALEDGTYRATTTGDVASTSAGTAEWSRQPDAGIAVTMTPTQGDLGQRYYVVLPRDPAAADSFDVAPSASGHAVAEFTRDTPGGPVFWQATSGWARVTGKDQGVIEGDATYVATIGAGTHAEVTLRFRAVAR